MLRHTARIHAVRPLTLLITLTLLMLFGVTVGVSTATTATTALTPECLGSTDRVRVGAGSSGADPASITAGQAAALERRTTARTQARRLSTRGVSNASLITVDVRWHVITADDRTGGVTRSQIRRQLDVLNDAFAGRGAANHSARTPFQFRTKSIDYTANSDWYDWADPDEDPSDEVEAKAALHQGGFDDLNIYIAALGDGLLGYAYLPGIAPLTYDGVVLLNESLPGGDAAPYNEGDTATHEVGHWLGLFHTFDNGCDYPGDYVPDTPYQDDGENIFSCEESLNTCPQPGRDPVHNFMSYGDDPCLDRFSRGQAFRMALQWFAWRSDISLLP